MTTKAFGIILEVEDSPGAGTYTPIPKILEITFPDFDKDEWDATTHDSTNCFEEALATVKRTGVFVATLKYDHTEALHVQAWADYRDDVNRNYQLTIPNSHGAIPPFEAFVKTVAHGTAKADGFTRDVSFRVTGPVDYV